jgi:serine phosphatase RsbU (regulator of sigma subunit)
MHPIDEVGGDYYDIINVDGWDWLIIGDVSGHGVVAGLIMMMVETAVKSVLHQQAELSATRLLEIVNGVLIENLKLIGEDRYMTITALAYRKKGVFYFSGMHQDILVYRARENKVESIETRGIWLGVQGVSLPDLKDIKLTMAPGDTMLLYTDGITEVRNPEKKMFEKKRLIKTLQDNGNSPVQEIKTAIHAALDGYTQDDDLTFVIVRKTDS